MKGCFYDLCIKPIPGVHTMSVTSEQVKTRRHMKILKGKATANVQYCSCCHLPINPPAFIVIQRFSNGTDHIYCEECIVEFFVEILS